MSKPTKVTLGDGSIAWEVYFREGGRGSKQTRKRFRSSREAQEFLESIKDDRRQRHLSPVSSGSFFNTTFKEEALNWLGSLELRVSPGHLRRSKDIVEDFNQNYGSLTPNEVTPAFLTGLQRSLKQRRGNRIGKTWSNASVNRYTEVICAVLNFSVGQRRIPYNPLSGFKKLPKNSPEMLFWDEQEARSFLAWAKQKYSAYEYSSKLRARKNYIAYFLAINTGMRAGEIWGLKPSDLIFDGEESGGTIFVRRQFNSVIGGYTPLKGGLVSDKDKSRHVPCPQELCTELEKLIRFNRTGKDQPLFQSALGRPINHDAFADRFERDLKQWGGRKIRFHDLRHTAATLMLSKGIDVKTVSEILGHEDLATTMIYVHLLGDRIRQVAKSFAIQPASETQISLRLVSNPKN